MDVEKKYSRKVPLSKLTATDKEASGKKFYDSEGSSYEEVWIEWWLLLGKYLIGGVFVIHSLCYLCCCY
jgi:hypothetical protein